jgi:integrase/recombinase XerC
MARFRQPFFRKSRGLWYVWHDGRQVNLGADKDTAFVKWHDLTVKAKRTITCRQTSAPLERLVVVIVDEFLDWCQKHRSPDTYRWYKDRLNDFCKSIAPDLTVEQFKPHHVQKWVDAKENLASGSRRNLIAAAKRSMKWAEEQGYVDRSALSHMRKPACGRKEQVVSNTQFQAILDNTKDQQFKDLLTVSWETGCRPQESLRVEARHVDLSGERWVFPASESKGKKTSRVVYLSPKAVEISKQLMEKHPSGPLFRNVDGLPWTPDATNCRFQRIKKKLNTKFSLYALRHTWINRMLLRGVDAFTVAILAGHSDPSMLAKHYAHLSQAPGFLREQVRRVSA